MKLSKLPVLIAMIAVLGLVFTTSVFANWNSFVVDDGGDDQVGHHTSMEIINGQPAISYVDYTNNNLIYVRANDAANKDWGTPVTIDTSNVQNESDLLLVDGLPAIAYFDSSNNHLKFVRAKDANGTTWNTPITVDGTGIANGNLGAFVVDGNPAICYLDSANYYLMYVRATDAQGSSWGTPQPVDNSADTGYECSINIVDGYPAISYWEFDGDEIKFVRALDAAGSSWDAPQSIGATKGSTYVSELRIVNGNPALAYHDYMNNQLKYVRATNTVGSAWGTPLVLDSSGNDVGLFTSFDVVDGAPAVSYVVNNFGNPFLRFIHAADASGTTWNKPSLVADDHTGWWNSLRDFNGQAAISFFDTPTTGLRFALFDSSANNTIYLPIMMSK